LGIIVLGVISIIAIVVIGFIDQIPSIVEQLGGGWTNFEQWIDQNSSVSIDPTKLEEFVNKFAAVILQGVFSILGGTFSSIAGFLIGTFLGVFLLYYFIHSTINFCE
jgi:predicted PurR-regulated permease PerM